MNLHRCYLNMLQIEERFDTLHLPERPATAGDGLSFSFPGPEFEWDETFVDRINDTVKKLRGVKRRVIRLQKIGLDVNLTKLENGDLCFLISHEGGDAIKSIVNRGRPKEEMRVLAEEHLRSNPQITAAPLLDQIDPTAKGSRRQKNRIRLQSAINKSRKTR